MYKLDHYWCLTLQIDVCAPGQSHALVCPHARAFQQVFGVPDAHMAQRRLCG
jgi:hypothetical protein